VVRRQEKGKCKTDACGLSLSFASTADVLRKQQFGVSPPRGR
jgi:hypothetical protein